MGRVLSWILVFCISSVLLLSPEESQAEVTSSRAAAYAAAFSLDATDATFEEGVRLSWSESPPEGYVFHVRRDGTLLSLSASTDTFYIDYSGVPGVEYDYCVDVIESGSGSILTTGCDLGRRIIFPPELVSASDGAESDHVQVTWSDRSFIETGFRIDRRVEDGGTFLEIGVAEANVERFEDASADSGVVYQYCVVAHDIDGNESESSCDIGFRGFVQPPAVLVASDGQFTDRVTLTWIDDSDDEVEFRIYRDGAQIGSVPENSTTYEDFDGLGVSHEYCVTSVREIPEAPFTLESIQVCDAGIGGDLTLAGPIELASVADEFDDKVTLSWGDPGEVETGYTVLRDAIAVADLAADADGYEDFDAVPGVTHEYCVVSTSEAGGQSIPACVSGIRAHVLAPTLVTAADGTFESKTEIVWESSSTTAVLYEILRDGEGIKTLSGHFRSYSDREVDAGQAHEYCVRGYTALGEASVTTCDPGSRVILAPSDFSASDQGFEDRVLLSWQDRSQVESGFAVYRKVAGSTLDPTQIATRGRNRGSYIDETGVPGTEYEYTVSAFDSLGESASVSDNGLRTLVAPSEVSAGDGAFEDRVVVEWQDGSFSEIGFRIRRDGAFIDTVATNVSSYVDTGADFGVSHLYEVSAFDLYGESASAGDVGITTIEAPGSVRASDTYRDRVVLVWTDESEIETSYTIYRDGQVLGSTVANATSFVDESAAENVVHNYCVTSEAGAALSDQVCDFGTRPLPSGNLRELDQFLSEIPSQGYGQAVDVDGNTAVVSDASLTVGPSGNFGTVYVYSRNLETRIWERSAQLLPPTASGTFGWSVGLSGDWCLVGAANDPEGTDFTFGSVFAYKRINGTWVFQQEFRSANTASGKRFGNSLDLDGTTVIVGNAEEASPAIQDAAVFELVGSQWVETASLRTLFDTSQINQFGGRVAVDGDRAVVSDRKAPGIVAGAGRAHVFSRASGSWAYETTLFADDGFNGQFFSVSLDIHGDNILIGSRDNANGTLAGAAYAYRRVDGAWQHDAKIVSSDIQANQLFSFSLTLGEHVALIGSGVGGPGEVGAVYAFSYDELQGWDERYLFTPVGGSIADWYLPALAFDGQTGFVGTASSTMNRAYPIDIGVLSPSSVAASDDVVDGPIRLSWVDRSDQEDGYRVYRNDELIQTLDSDFQIFNDFDSRPGEIYSYCVVAYNDAAFFGESFPTCDFGRRPADGNITGRIATRFGAGVDSVTICLDPLPNHSLLFDGERARVRVENAAFPADELTLEFWLRSSSSTAGATPLSYATSGQPNTLVVRDDSNFVIDVNGVSSTATGVSTNDGDWHHVAVTWRSSDGRVELFKDGELAFTQNGVAAGTNIPSGGTVVFGQEQGYFGGGFDPAEAFLGQMDEVRLWNQVRTGEEVATTRTRTILTPAEEQEIAARWTFDQGTGRVVQDLGSSALYGELLGGVHWAPGAETMESCVRNDLQGNYALTGLRYANSSPIRVTPVLEGHVFEPAYKIITLSTLDPVENEVEFIDVTTFSVTGLIRYESTFCFGSDIELYVDGAISSATDVEGNFALALSPGEHVIEPRKEGHTFDPPSYTVDVDRNLTGRNFLDTTRFQLFGQVGGGCDLPIGRLQLSVVNDCFDETVLETDRDFDIAVPPGKYFIRVLDVIDPPEVLDRADILSFFEDLGPQAVDLTLGDVRQDFVFRAPLAVSIEGLPDVVCPTIIDTSRGVNIPGVPILHQFDTANLVFRVFEDYGNGNVCPLDSAVVSIFDEVQDKENQATVLTTEEGKVTYKTIASTPNIFFGRVDTEGNDRSYQKPITFVVETPGREPITHTEWFFVTGDRPRTGSFVSATSQEIPLLILRDPQGDGSFAELERGKTTSFSFSDMFTETIGTGFKSKIKAGIQIEKGALFWSTNTEAGVETEFGVEFGIEAVQSNQVTSTISLIETLATSSDELFVGEGADIFLGMALNLIFAKSDVVSIDPVSCVLTRSDTVRVGGADQRFATTYLYTRDHIKNVIIPQLTDLGALLPADAPYYAASIANWNKQLLLADRLRDEALASPGGNFPFGYWPPMENRSFSAGADRSFTFARGSTDTDIYSVEVYAESENSIGFGFKDSGTGSENAFVIKLGFKYQHEVERVEEDQLAVTYTLSDNDTGDYFSTDVAYDRRYGTPVFRAKSGRSSCPWEPGTQPRDSTIIAIEPPVLHDVDPSGPGSFTLSLTNASPSEEGREYVLLPIQTSNPGGAILRANGESFSGGLPFFLGSDTSQEVTLTVDRGPNRFFYDDIQLQLVSPCEYERWQNGGPLLLADTVSFSIDYAAPCSDISLFEPKSGWAFNLNDSDVTQDTLGLTLDDFVLQLSEVDRIQGVGAQYRKVDTDVWFPVASVDRDSIPVFPDGQPKSVEIPWDVSGIVDGSYELRAFTQCDIGKAFSLPATGIVDRVSPSPFGAPQPSDAVLAFGDEISITFQEDILCQSVNDVSVRLEYADTDTTTAPMIVDLSCNGTTIVITPTAPPLETLEGMQVTATVFGIKDLAGNVMESSSGGAMESWSFEVMRSAIAWTDADVIHRGSFRSPGNFSASLVNGLGMDAVFELTDVPEWLTPSVWTGSILSTDFLEIEFVVAETLSLGSHEAVLNAVFTDPPAVIPLSVRVELECRPPVWSFDPGDFEQSMTLVMQASTGGGISRDPNDVVGAFVGTEVRGVGQTVYVPELDDWMTFLTVHSNRVAGESIRFRIFDSSECLTYGSTDSSFRFEADSRIGEAVAPKLLLGLDEVPLADQLIDLREGWTWFSLNLSNVDMSLDYLLGDLNPQSGDLIKSQTKFSQYDEQLGWLGSLELLDARESYVIRLSNAGTLVISGDPISPSSLPIPVADGWNWVGYLPQVPLEVADALGGLVPTTGDEMMIRAQLEFAQHVEESGTWSGSLENMKPGQGYRLYLDNAFASDNKLEYPEGILLTDLGYGESERPLEALSAGVELSWPGSPELDVHEFEHAMTLTGTIEMASDLESTDLIVGAFVGDELRGLASVQSVPSSESGLLFLMIHGNLAENESISLRAFDSLTQSHYEIEGQVAFRADGVLGTVREPVVLHAFGSGSNGVPLAFGLVPQFSNPVRARGPVEFRFSLPKTEKVVFRLFDVQGREVATLVDDVFPAGVHEAHLETRGLRSGVYLYKMQAGKNRTSEKLVVIQ